MQLVDWHIFIYFRVIFTLTLTRFFLCFTRFSVLMEKKPFSLVMRSCFMTWRVESGKIFLVLFILRLICLTKRWQFLNISHPLLQTAFHLFRVFSPDVVDIAHQTTVVHYNEGTSSTRVFQLFLSRQT